MTVGSGLTLTIALWVTAALVLLAAIPTAWVLTREWLRRRAAALALARVAEARLLADGAIAAVDTAVPELARLLTARFDGQTVERAVTGLLGDADPARRARASALFAELGLDVVFAGRLREGVKWTERTRAAEVLGAAGLSSAVPALVQVLRDRYEDEASVKISAAAALAKLRDGSAIPLLVSELKDADERATRNVGEALVAFGGAAVPALMGLLEDANTAGGGGAGGRVWAAQILGRIGDGRATDLLVARLHDRDDRLRMVVAEALGTIGDARAIGAIVRATLRDPAPQVRAHAAGALARLEGERAVDVLVAALADPDYATRLRALEAFETIRVVDTAPLESSLRDANPEVRRRAALALERVGYLEARIGDLTGTDRAGRAQAYEAILELGRVGLADSVVAYVNHASFEVRATAARAAGELGSTRSAPLLLAALDDEMWPVRAAAAEALGRLKAEEAVVKLVARVSDGEEAVREAAAEALTAFAPAHIEAHAAALVEAYDHGSVTVRTHVVVLLDRLTAEGAAVAEALLVRAAVDPSDTVRLRAVTALGARGGEIRVQPLLQRLTDASLEVRMAAVAAFGAEATHEAFEGLLRALAGSSPEMRDRIADALSQSERSEHLRGARGPLFARLDEIERTATVDVKIGIAWTLGRTGQHVSEEESVRTLTRFLADRDAKLRASAAGALAKIPGQRSVTALLTAEGDPDDRVRAAVMNALGQNPADTRVAAALERRLRDPDAFVRNRALVMLARVGGPAVHGRVVKLSPLVTAEAGWVALALVGTDEALAQVLTAVADAGTLGRIVRFVAREHPEVRAAFFAALKLEDPDPQATAGEIDRVMQTTYEQLLRTSLDVEARRLAVKAVGQTTRATAIEPLADALTGDPDERVRFEAAAALASRTGDARARKALSRAVADPSAEVAMRAAHALASRADPEVTAALVARLGAGAPEVQGVVEQMLADRYRDDPFPFLDQLMGNDVPALLVPGIRVLARMARVETLPLLQSLARSKVAVVRAEAVRALAALPLPEATRSVDGLLLDPQEEVRIAVLEALMLRGDALLRTSSLRRDPSVAVRLAAVRAIELQAMRAGAVSPGTLDALAAMLEDAAPAVRAAALVSLAGLPDDEGLGARPRPRPRSARTWSGSGALRRRRPCRSRTGAPG